MKQNVFCKNQIISIWDKKLNKYRNVVCITAGGGRIKVKNSSDSVNEYWIPIEDVNGGR